MDHLRRLADPPVGLDPAAGSLYFSLAGFLGFYGFLFVEMILMVKYAAGPSSLHTGKYHWERLEASTTDSTAKA